MAEFAEFLTPDHPRGVKPPDHSWLLDRASGRGHRICKWCGLTQRPEDVIEHEAMKAYETWIQVIEDNPKPWHTLQPKQRASWIRSIKDCEATSRPPDQTAVS